MFKLIFLAAAIFLLVTSKPQDNGRYKKRLAETQLNFPPFKAQGDSGICLANAVKIGEHYIQTCIS